MTITSHTNQHFKEIRKLARASARARSERFVAEGEDLYAAAHAAGRGALYVLCAPGLAAGRENWFEADAALLAKASRLGSGARVIGVYPESWTTPVGPLCVALWGVHDPGNVGTIIRAAEAFGASSVALGADCADPYGPKAVRASMGAIFATPIARFSAMDELPGEVVGLVPGYVTPLRGPIHEPTTLLIGGERDGLPPETLAQCSRVCSIPQVAGDSLNAAMAATVALYEATRMASE
ncbi:MAG: RNA methyltransferase [Solirubrobacteraceae bacterium]|jgi:TrmH family RNA methyltransferase